MKPKIWELAMIFLVVFIVYAFFMNKTFDNNLSNFADEDISLEELAYENADSSLCDAIDDDYKKHKCVVQADKKKEVLSGQLVKGVPVDSSLEDRKILGKAMFQKNLVLCEEIINEVTKKNCLEYLS